MCQASLFSHSSPLPGRSRQAIILGRKRQEYYEMVPQYYDISNAERSEEELTALRQVWE